MANQNQNNQKANNGVVTEPQGQQTAGVPAQAETPQVVVQQPAETQKQGFGGWLKQHWKGAVAVLTGAAAVGGSAVVAYKRGKAAGIMSVPVPQQEQEDYSLNPNQ